MTEAKAPTAPVVVGVDGSETSLHAAVYAGRVARRRALPLLVVHLSPWRLRGDALPMTAPEIRERFQESAQVLVEEAADAVRRATGLASIEARVVEDYPVDGLLALSAEASLLVLGRRGIGGFPGLLLGSTADAVVQHAECPVFVLPEEDVHDDPQHPVVVGVEGGGGDEQVLAFAVAEAVARGTGLTAVHAWRDPSLEAALGQFGPLVDWSGVEDEERRQLAASLAGWRAKQPGVEITEAVVRGRPAAALLDAATGALLLVVGHRRRGLLTRFGSTTHGVLHRAACPVAVVPLGSRGE
jgi:nucleotide-binding universal stress UspA family protein